MITPSSDFYVLGGTLPRNARSYATRKADEDLLDGLRKGQFCYVLTSRQMGKSSLMVRTVAQLRQENVTCLVIDLTAIGQNLTEDQWYDGLLSRIAIQLHLEEQLDAFWQEQERLGPLQRWMHALQTVVLPHVGGPIVLFVDEIDAVRSLPFSADEFFAAVRECYNRRTEDKQFQRLTFCLLGVATPADLIRDTRSTPFNIGRRIPLTDFTEAEATPLAEGLSKRESKREWKPEQKHAGRSGETAPQELLRRVLYWTHGHPYLTQRLCQAVVLAGAQSASEVDVVCAELFLAPGAQDTDDNLLFVRERLLRDAYDPTGLLLLYAKVHAGKRILNSETDPHISTLRLSGVVRVSNGLLCVRNRIYAQVFDQNWIRTNIPGVERRRQKSAFRKGVFGTSLTLGAILLLSIGVFLFPHYQRHLNLHLPLQDGTELIVHDVSYGKEVNYEAGMFRGIPLLSQSHTITHYPRPIFCVWLSHYNPQVGKRMTLAMSAITAIDEHGRRYIPSQGLFNPHTLLMGYGFHNFPRRNKTVHLQLQDPNGVVIKDFEVPNPTPSLYPLWIPEPLPSTKQIGDLAINLKSVKWDPAVKLTAINGSHSQGPTGIRIAWECRQEGRITTAWQADSIAVADATGNTSEPQAVGYNLSNYEPAWRVRFQLVRTPEASISAGETWTLKDVPVPKNGSAALLTGSGEANGITLNPVSLSLAPKVTYREKGNPVPEGSLMPNWDQLQGMGISRTQSSEGTVVTGYQPQVALRMSGLKENQRLIVWATDSGGHRYLQDKAITTFPPGGDEMPPLYTRFLPIPQSVYRVDLHFCVQEICTVDFMVRPPLTVPESKIR